MNIKTIKFLSAAASVAVLAGSVAIASASAQVTASVTGGMNMAMPAVSASAAVHTDMRMNGQPGGRMGSTTRMSSTTRQQMMEQRQGQQVGKIDTKAGSEITARIASLNQLLSRVSAMTKLSASQKTNISSEISSLISEMTTLQGQIQVDASSTPTGSAGDISSTSPLRQAYQSITKDYRVYALVIPQVEILAAADRIGTIVSSLTTLAAKLQTRITALQTAGQNVTSVQASLSDLNAKIADAQTQTSAAVNSTANLTPDQGNATVAASNTAALKAARTNIQTAMSDIKAADADAHSIVSAIEGTHVKASVSASSTTSVQ